MAKYMVWYRTKTGKIKTVKVNAKTQSGAINQAKKKPGFAVKMRVLKLKGESPTKKARKRTTKKRTVRKKTKKKTAPKKRAVKRTKRKTTKNPNPKKRGRRKMARKRTTKKRRRRRRNPGGGKKGITQTLMYGAMSAAGAIGGGFIANMIPLPDPRMKAALPLAMGVGLSMTKFGQQKQFQPMIAGLLTVGTLSLIKQFAPQIPMLAGEEDMITDDEALDLLGLDEEDDLDLLGQEDIEDEDLDLLGITAEEGDLDELTGDSVEIGEEDEDFITSADI